MQLYCTEQVTEQPVHMPWRLPSTNSLQEEGLLRFLYALASAPWLGLWLRLQEFWATGGRRVLWVSTSRDLAYDARRDLDDMGCGNINVHPKVGRVWYACPLVLGGKGGEGLRNCPLRHGSSN